MSVTMVRHVHNGVLAPAEQKVADGGPQHGGQTQPRVVRHDDEHQQVGQGDLQEVEAGEHQMS